MLLTNKIYAIVGAVVLTLLLIMGGAATFFYKQMEHAKAEQAKLAATVSQYQAQLDTVAADTAKDKAAVAVAVVVAKKVRKVAETRAATILDEAPAVTPAETEQALIEAPAKARALAEGW